jgi:hypothetical protein
MTTFLPAKHATECADMEFRACSRGGERGASKAVAGIYGTRGHQPHKTRAQQRTAYMHVPRALGHEAASGIHAVAVLSPVPARLEPVLRCGFPGHQEDARIGVFYSAGGETEDSHLPSSI